MTAMPWNWSAFEGSASVLKYARRDLPHLEAVIRLVPTRRLCVQAGGNVGIWPKALSAAFDTVLTCEPDPENFAMLLANVDEPNVQAFPVALGAACGYVGLSRQRRDGKPHSHEGCVHVAGAGEIEMVTIDTFDLRLCDLIYLDIEGYELHALRGAVRTLQTCRPIVAVEVNQHLGSYGIAEAELYAFMESMGYRLGPCYGVDRVFLPDGGAAC